MTLSQRTPLVLGLIAILTIGLTLSFVFLSIPPTDNNPTHTEIRIDLIGAIDTGGAGLRVHVEGNLAFVIDTGTEGTYGLIIVNIADPMQPTIVGTYHAGGLPFAIDSEGDIVYIADQIEGLIILNISDVANPTPIPGFTGSRSYDIELIDDLLYLADDEEGLVILNASNPSAPEFISNYGQRCIHLAIEGDIAYSTIQGLSLIDISDSMHPSLLSNREDGTGFWDPSVSNGILYLANHNGGVGELQVYNVTNPYNVEKISEFDSEGNFQSFDVQDSILYAVDFDIGLYLLDVRNPSSPSEIAL
ncbi:MAG: LVIVD repeat-containing protein, partial [Candidatus Thorarchaeota archaeon]